MNSDADPSRVESGGTRSGTGLTLEPDPTPKGKRRRQQKLPFEQKELSPGRIRTLAKFLLSGQRFQEKRGPLSIIGLSCWFLIMEMGIKIGGHIDRVSGKELSYREFVERYMKKNEPVVITGLMDDWRACRDWVTGEGKPNLPFFSAHYGKSRVQVVDCNTKEFTDQKRVEMSVSEFVHQWLNCQEGGHTDISLSERNAVLYLKDWHFVKEYPEYTAYMTPLLFRDDWLNLYLDYYRMHKDPDTFKETNEVCCSDYRFVYMGAKGSWTPLHADVFRSYSWSANVCGKKQWLFLPPSQHHLVFDRNMKNSVYDIFNNVDNESFPGFKKVRINLKVIFFLPQASLQRFLSWSRLFG
ncbi:hypothetical protein SAY86_004112 [Trapa natans]|uniref:JmjC domain-containing protein n=1 Tax=Trapa natans TaxID=22666 RepID=A0AAN7MY76_TRANT|nr:hypothetical protein SAY86_004112 [Trapa natans]